MKRIIFFAGLISLTMNVSAQWKPAGDKIKTKWAETVAPNKVLLEYPRPLMERQNWVNLNGLWDYAIRPDGTATGLQSRGKQVKKPEGIMCLKNLNTEICKMLPVENAQDNVSGKVKYRNPVINRSVPDPTLIQVADGSFYLYGTEDIRNTPIFHSTDLVNWKFAGTAFTDETRPTFEPKGGLWAPNINYINGKYVLYYSMSVWGGEMTSGIGVSVSDRPDGPFTDLGMLFRSNTIGVQNSIDQDFIEDGGKKYLFWGSFSGLFGIEMTDDGLKVKEGSEKRQVAGKAYEAISMHKRGKYYYMFASIGSCCRGLESTYTLVVGRSENLWGPYTDKQGKSMMDNHHEVVISKNEAFVGVGHCSQIVQDKAGNDWIFYHGVQVTDPRGRKLLMDKIVWIDEWPTVAGGSPSLETDAPVF